MKKEDLIEKLQKLPEGTEICVFDWRKNLSEDSGDGSSYGIYPKIDIEFTFKQDLGHGKLDWVGLSFDNDDYDDSGINLTE